MNNVQHREFKDQLFGQLARITKALSSPRRLELVDLLAQGERHVDELADLTGMSVANASQHLQALRAARLVSVRRDGPRAHYALCGESVFRAWQAVRDLGHQQLAEVDRLLETYVSERAKLEGITASELLRRLRADDVIVLDVRPEPEFRAGHILGARSVPLKELQRRLTELPRRTEVVAYCRGPFCVYADEAVALLQRRGYRARRLDTGFPDWKHAGLPVGTGGENGAIARPRSRARSMNPVRND